MSQSSNINPIPSDFSWCPPEDRLRLAVRSWLIWVQGLYRYRPVGQHRWNPNFDETEIIITDQNPDDVEKTNKRPIISTSRGPASWSGTSLGQSERPVFSNNKVIYSDIIGTSITMSIVAREGLEAQDIAYTIFRMIPVFKRSLNRFCRLHAIGNNITITPETAMGQLVPGSSRSEWKMVQIHVPIWIQDRISVESQDFHTLVRAVNLQLQEGEPTLQT